MPRVASHWGHDLVAAGMVVAVVVAVAWLIPVPATWQ
jgi:hypothetical protein